MPNTGDEGPGMARHAVGPDPPDSKALVRHMKVSGNLGCTDCDSEVQGEGSKMKRITTLDSGLQTLTSTGICLDRLREHGKQDKEIWLIFRDYLLLQVDSS